MKNIREIIKNELARLIPSTKLKTTSGKYFMRFELGGEGNRDPLKRVEQATSRAIEIYKQLIGSEDELIIEIEEYEGNQLFDINNECKDYLYQIIDKSKLKRFKGPLILTVHKAVINGVEFKKTSDVVEYYDLLIGKIKLDLNQAELIIRGKAALEMGEVPCISQRVRFFSINKEVGFNIYDDRGCDIWSNDLEILRPIYQNLNSWILDYNRPKIDKMFLQ